MRSVNAPCLTLTWHKPFTRRRPHDYPALWLLVTLLLGLMLSDPALAASAEVQLSQPQSRSFSTGEQVPFSVQILVKGQFSGSTYFDLPEVEGAIIMQASDRPVLGTQLVDTEMYAVSTYEFALYPQRGGRVIVPSFVVRFGSRERYDLPVIEHHVTTEAFVVDVKAPAGALPTERILSASKVSATETWSPQPYDAVVGDAFTRTVTLRAEGVAAMLLPAPKFGNVKGLASYVKAPLITDQAERVEFTGQRIDSVTYVCERAGVFEIPELSFRWWDPVKAEWKTKRFPAVSLKVADNPALASMPAVRSDAGGSLVPAGLWIRWLALAVLVVVLLLFTRARVVKRWQSRAEQRSGSETALWTCVLKACKSSDAVEAYHALNQWLAIFNRASTDLTLHRVDGVSDRLAEECIRLQQKLSGTDDQWHTRVFAVELATFRRMILMDMDTGSLPALPPLNPTSQSVVANPR